MKKTITFLMLLSISLAVLANHLQTVESTKHLFVGKELYLKESIDGISAGTKFQAVDLPHNKKVHIANTQNGFTLNYNDEIEAHNNYLAFKYGDYVYEFYVK